LAHPITQILANSNPEHLRPSVSADDILISFLTQRLGASARVIVYFFFALSRQILSAARAAFADCILRRLY
jgi:hypothetical protein